jgi:hypothetical protein
MMGVEVEVEVAPQAETFVDKEDWFAYLKV